MFVHYKLRELATPQSKTWANRHQTCCKCKSYDSNLIDCEKYYGYRKISNNNNKIEEFKNKHHYTEDRTLWIDMVQQ